MFSITIDMPNLPKGGTLVIDGLGEFVNGETVDITDEDAASYQARKPIVTSDFDDQGLLHTSLEDGPTLMEALANHPYITVTTKVPPMSPPKIVTTPPTTPPTDATLNS